MTSWMVPASLHPLVGDDGVASELQGLRSIVFTAHKPKAMAAADLLVVGGVAVDPAAESDEGLDQAIDQRHHRQLGAIRSTQLVFGIHHVGLHRFD